MLDGLLSMFSTTYAVTIIYMLQSTEYQVMPYLRWYWRTNNFSTVTKRRQLERTSFALLLLWVLRLGLLIEILVGLSVLIVSVTRNSIIGCLLSVFIITIAPVLWAHLIAVIVLLGRLLIVEPRNQRQIVTARKIFATHKGLKIAIAGSYGKTSMKELLLTVLSEGKQVAATPANKNILSSHAKFAATLSGNEDILLIEYGEGKPGDIRKFAKVSQPDIGIITGLAPAHLDHYPSITAAGEDIFSLTDVKNIKKIYVNGDSGQIQHFMRPQFIMYNNQGIDGWKVTSSKITYKGIYFEAVKGKKHLKLNSGLVGRHQLGALLLAVVLGLECGLSNEEIQAGIAKTAPYEHRMQPRNLDDAIIIDDTYNGNIEGVRAGLALMAELKAKRKIYVTPGLVDQGKETVAVHEEIGRLIARAQPDEVVLMQNSTTHHIQQGLHDGKYQGKVLVENNPLEFYTNIDKIVAAGDLVLMQNDWPDNYY